MVVGMGGGGDNSIEIAIETKGAEAAAAQIAAVEGGLLNMRTAAAAAGLALAGLAGGAMYKATQAAAAFETSMVELEKVIDPNVTNLGALEEGIREMAGTIPLAQTEIADLAAQAARFGVQGEENILRFTEAVAKMAVATDLSASEAGEAFAKLATLTNTPITEVENLGSAINVMANNFATSASEVVDAALRSSAALTQLGVSQTDIIGLSAALNEVSVSGEIAGSGLRRLAQDLQAPTAAFLEGLLPALGLTEEQFRAMRDNDPTGLILRMAEVMAEGGDKAELLASGMTTFSRQALAGLGQNLEGVNAALAQSAAAYEENASLQAEFEAASQTLELQMQLLRNAVMEVALQLGQALLPAVKVVVSIVRTAVDAFSRFNDATNGMAAVVLTVTGVIGGLSVAFVALYPQIMAAATVASGVLAPALVTILGPAALVTTAVLALGAAWATNFADIQGKTQELVSLMSSTFGPVLQRVMDTGRMAAQQLAGAWSAYGPQIEAAITRIWDVLMSALIPVLKLLGSVANAVMTGVNNTFNMHGDGVAETIFGTILVALNALASGLETLQAIVGRVLGVANGIWQAHGQTIQRVIGGTIMVALGVFMGALRTLQATVTGVFGYIASTLNTHAQNVAARMSDMGGATSDFGDILGVGLKGDWETARFAAQDSLTTMAFGVTNRMSEMGGRVSQFGDILGVGLRGDWETAKFATKDTLQTMALDVASRMSEMGGLISDFGDILGVTLKGDWQTARFAANDVMQTMKADVVSFIQGVLAPFAGFGTALASAYAGNWQLAKLQAGITLIALVQDVERFIGSIPGRVTAAGTAIRAAMEQPFANARITISNTLNALETTVRDIMGRVAARLPQPFQQALGTINGALVQIHTTVSTALGRVEQLWATHGPAIVTRVQTAYANVRTQVQTSLGIINQVTGNLLGQVKTKWDTHKSAVLGVVTDLAEQIKRHPREALTLLASTIVPGPLGLIVAAFETNFAKIKRNVRTALTETNTLVRDLMATMKTEIVTPLRDSESETRITLGSMKTEFSESFATMREIVSRVMGVILDIQNEHLAGMIQVWNTHMNGPNGMIANARDAFNALWRDVIKPILDIIQAGWDLFGDDLLRIGKAFWSAINIASRTALDLLLTIINVALDVVSRDWEGAWTTIRGFFERLWTNMTGWLNTHGKNIFTSAVSIILTAAEALFTGFANWLFRGGNFIQKLFTDIGTWIRQTAKTIWNNSVGAVIESVKTAFTQFGTWLFRGSFIKDLFLDVANWIRTTAKNAISNAVGSIITAVNNKFKLIDVSPVTNALNNLYQLAQDVIDKIKGVKSKRVTITYDEVHNKPGGGGERGGSGGSARGRGGGGSVGGASVSTSSQRQGFREMATGGIVEHPTHALIGEAGPEAVIPLSKAALEKHGLREDEDGSGTTVNVENVNINAETEEGGRAAAKGFTQELRRFAFNNG